MEPQTRGSDTRRGLLLAALVGAGDRRTRGRRARVHPQVRLPGVPAHRAGGQPDARSRHPDPRRRSRVHADRSVRAARLAVLVPRQGRDPRLQRPAVHDHLPADHDGDGQGQAAPGAGGSPRGTAGSGREPGRDRHPLGAGLLGSARDDVRLALPQRSAPTAEAGLARVRHRSANRGGGSRPHPRRVRDRQRRGDSRGCSRPRCPTPASDSWQTCSPMRRRACCRGIRRCVPRPPTPRFH